MARFVIELDVEPGGPVHWAVSDGNEHAYAGRAFDVTQAALRAAQAVVNWARQDPALLTVTT